MGASVPVMDLETLSREVVAIQTLRAEHEARLEGMARSFRDLHEHVRRSEHLREIQAEVDARALEQVELLRSRMEGEHFQRVESLAVAFEESRRSQRQSSSAVASVMRRMEARLQDAVGQPRPVSPEESEQEPLEVSRLEPLSRRLDDLEVRLDNLGLNADRTDGSSDLAEGLLARLEALESRSAQLDEQQAGSSGRAEGLLVRLEALESRSAQLDERQAGSSGLAEGLLARLEALESRSEQLDEQQAGSSGRTEGLLVRLEALESRSAQLDERQAEALTSEDLEGLLARLEDLESRSEQLDEQQAEALKSADLEGLLARLEGLESRSEQLGKQQAEALKPADLEKLLVRLEGLESRSEQLGKQQAEALKPADLEKLAKQQAEALKPADLEKLAKRVRILEPALKRLEVLEAHLESLPEFAVRLDVMEVHLESLPEIAGRLDQLENLQERLEKGAVSTEERLTEALSLQVDQALLEVLPPLNERIDRLPREVQELLDELDFSELTDPLTRRLDVLADEVQQARHLAESSGLQERVQTLEDQGLAARLDRVESEIRRQAERMEEELEAVFEQNRLRVAEMTNTFDERMALLENAVDRVRELEETTLRSRAETGHVLQAAFDRMEALTSKLGQLEDQVSAASPPQDSELLHELHGVVTHLESRMHFLEAAPSHLVPATPEPARTFSSGSGTEEDPQKGLAPAELHGLSAQISGGAIPQPGVVPQDLEILEQKIQDVELRLVEQNLEALTESRLLREEYERIAYHLSDLSENLNQHFEAIWDRLEPA
ncbi:MAG: hypothetical protein GX934_03990 [Burkholderiales bacterium]|nr:hypothetical protein [Burkholderiales bacterium]